MKIGIRKVQQVKLYKIYPDIVFGTNRQTFNKNIGET